MPAYLMKWNPNKWFMPDERPAQILESLSATNPWEDHWSTGGAKRITPGDRLYFIRLGVEPRGIFGSGRATSEVFEDLHYNDERAAEGEKSTYVHFVWDEFINPREDILLTKDLLNQQLPNGPSHWTPQSSGCSIDAEIEVRLEEMWQKHLKEVGAGNLRIVTTLAELRTGIRSFKEALDARDELTKFALGHPYYFVYDPLTNMFAPAKWAGIRGITASTYRALQNIQQEEGSFRGFDGGRVQRQLAKRWGAFRSRAEGRPILALRFGAAPVC